MGNSLDDVGSSDPTPPPRVAVITMVRDEGELLPVWLRHYGEACGYDNLVVLDDHTVDGSTDDLPCTTYRLPEGPWKADWGRTRLRLVNGLATALLAVNDFVIYTDVDEFLVPDPAHCSGLGDYLSRCPPHDVIAPMAVEVIHHLGLEPALDLRRPVLPQRGFGKFTPALCKPLVRRGNARWHKAFHSSVSPFPVDPRLWMFHLKFADDGLLRTTARAREEAHRTDGRGHPRSFWAMSEDQVVAKLASWTQGVSDAPDLDPGELDLADLVQLDERGHWQAVGNQVEALETSPLRRIPDRFRDTL